MVRVTGSGGRALMPAGDPLTRLTLLEAVLRMNQSKICSLNFELQRLYVSYVSFFRKPNLIAVVVGRQN
jgi:hypothetical protein